MWYPEPLHEAIARTRTREIEHEVERERLIREATRSTEHHSIRWSLFLFFMGLAAWLAFAALILWARLERAR